ncbi:hypothetical protein CROQUDRAFT_108667 [Cronartium quercuum f. sp. fusiforme G11]|uniref:RNase H type-1 domain-containing protein n=1 Tax=Cronartium quercuum f. sp. fusiforme G11 TaxID=708437 RepID=A0A9P6TB06_9BASI|nr:hypothetical protein CROQUDRAFT_108667 [Cronartium quercuum f. sp. fusiforme G11]
MFQAMLANARAEPWSEPCSEIGNVELNREEVKKTVLEQVQQEDDKGALVMLTDGSFIERKGSGAAYATELETFRESLGPMDGISNYEAEAIALAIFYDNQAALHLVNNPTKQGTAQYIAEEVHVILERIKIPIRLYWSPGHEGIKLNEAADEAAKTGDEEQTEITNLRYSLNRQAAAIFQLRSGHSPLRHHLSRAKTGISPLCPSCGIPETTAHFLVYCKKSSKQRRTFRNRLRKQGLKVDFQSASRLLDTPSVFPFLADYIEDTNRFPNLRKYTHNVETQ